jgi:hypothetical protein
MAGVTQGVFSKASEITENLPTTGQDTRYAVVFLAISILFFLAAIMALPMVLLSPGSFNLYFCMGSLNLQVALAFWYGPLTYVKTKLFTSENRIVSGVYVLSLIVCVYFIASGAGYLMSLLSIGI